MIKKIITHLEYKFHKFIEKRKRRSFEFWFNFYTYLFSKKGKIKFSKDYYFLINDFKEWKFYHKSQGLYAYKDGLEKRKNNLKNEYLINNIKFNEKDVIIDIGANNGDFYLCFEKKIKYYGFEPSPLVYSNLEYNIKNQNLYNLGLWKDSNKKLEFFLSDEFGNSSIIPIKNFTEKVLISTTTLDEIIDKIVSNVKLIKLEAEGAEPEVLEGLKKNLSKVEYITVDCGFERNEDKFSTLGYCSNYLIKNNFEIIDFGYPRIVLLFKNKSFLHNQKI